MTDAVLQGEGAAEAGASFTVEGGPGVAAEARAAIEPLRSRFGDEAAAEIKLILSELVTNSYRHSGARDEGIEIELRIAGDTLYGEVRDYGRGAPAAPVPELERDGGGWGLFIVDQLTDRWGVRRGPPSAVWFEVCLEHR